MAPIPKKATKEVTGENSGSQELHFEQQLSPSGGGGSAIPITIRELKSRANAKMIMDSVILILTFYPVVFDI